MPSAKKVTRLTIDKPTVDRKRSLAAKKGAITRALNREIASKRTLRLHHKIIAVGSVLAVLVFTVIGIRTQLETFAAVNSSAGTFVGIGNKCLDNSGAKLTSNNKIQLYTCNGTTAQKWVLTSAGSLKANNGSDYCLDIPGNATAQYTYLRLWKCNNTAAQHFKVGGGSIVSTTTGFCATVHFGDTDNGTKIWMKDCHSVLSTAQKWTYSASTTSTGTGTTTGSGGSTTKTGSGSGTTVVTGAGGDTGGTGIAPTGGTTYASLSGSDFGAKINSVGSGKYAILPSGSYTFKDFAYGTQGKSGTSAQGVGAYGANITSGAGILGAGSKYSTISMVANTSTKKDYVPPEAASGSANARTNQLQYILVKSSPYKVDGVKIIGTSQGHLYNGLMFNGISDVTVSNTTVTNVPGNDSGPPGETFMLNLYNLPSGGVANFTNVTIDGGKVAAVGIGLNSIKGTVTMKNLLTENTAYSAGVAGWQMSGTDNYYNWVNINSVRSYNAERHSGTSNFYDPVWCQPTSGHSDINYTWESGWKGGSINFYFTNAAAWQNYIAARTTKKITIVTNPHGQGDIRSTVNIYVGGVKQTTTDYVSWSGSAS